MRKKGGNRVIELGEGSERKKSNKASEKIGHTLATQKEVDRALTNNDLLVLLLFQEK